MPPRVTNIILGAALLACGLYAYHWHNELLSLRANLEELKAERDRLSRSIAEHKAVESNRVEQIAENPERELPDTRLSLRPAASPADGPEPVPSRGGSGRARFMAQLDNPEVQKLMSMQQKAALDSRFADLFRSLNLSPAALEKFKSLLVEKQTAVMDARGATRTLGLTGPENRDALRQVIALTQAEVDNNIRNTLGEAVFAQYQTYEQTLPERNVVAQLQQRLSYSSSPLTEAQTNQMVALLAANNSAANPSNNSGANNGFNQYRNGGPSVPITDASIASSKSVLNSAQIAALTQLQQEQLIQAELAAKRRQPAP